MSHSENATASAIADPDPTHCSICADHYTAVLRKKVVCSFCHKHTCSKCVENYLVSRHEDAHCLHCRVNYSDTTLRSICTQTYLKQKYYKHRQEVLMNRERAALPGLQDTALAAKKTRDDMKEAHAVWQTLTEMKKEKKKHLLAYHEINTQYYQIPAENGLEREALRLQMDEMRTNLDDMKDRMREYRRDYYEMRWNALYGPERHEAATSAGASAAAGEEKKTFIRRCLRDGCQGFLSTAWKCGLCEWYSCGTCLTVKGDNRNADHECKKEDVETADLIRKDAKPCPNCSQYIQKASGCFAKDTPVLLWDGNIVMSQDIREGNELVGDDGTKRTVLDTVTGDDEMYAVIQATGMTYTVNSKHTMVLYATERKEILAPFLSSADGIVEMRVEEYLLLSASVQATLHGFRGTDMDTHTPLIVTPVGRGTYYGWRVDGNHRFQLQDGTTVRNCSQMFCISCQTPFDWETGKIVTKGAIHNPHYYEWMSRNGGIPRNPMDIPCGGYPEAWTLYRMVDPYRTSVYGRSLWGHFAEFHRICTDIQDTGARTYRSHMDQDALQHLHVQFLLKDIAEEQWGRRLVMLEKKRKRDAEIQEVFAAFHMVATDMVGRVTRLDPRDESWEKTLVQWETEMPPFLDMINDAFRAISKSYSCTTPTICTEIDPHTRRRGYFMRYHNVMASKKVKAEKAEKADSDSDSDESV